MTSKGMKNCPPAQAGKSVGGGGKKLPAAPATKGGGTKVTYPYPSAKPTKR